MQLDKKLSAEREMLAERVKELEDLKEKFQDRLGKAKDLEKETPWDILRQEDVRRLSNELASIEFKLKEEKKRLGL